MGLNFKINLYININILILTFLPYNFIIQNMNFILAQIMGGIALVLVLISIFSKEKKYFFVIQVVANIFYALSFIFNGGLVAGINSFISVMRVLILYLFEKKKITPPKYLILVFSACYITVGFIFFARPIDIITMITPIMFTVAMWMKNMQLVRYTMISPNVLLTVYALILQVYTTALLDVIETIFLIVAIVKFYLHARKSQTYTSDDDLEKAELWRQ